MTTENTPQTVIDLACDLLRKLNSMIDDDAAKTIGKRIGNLARAQFIPDTGSGNKFACAFLMGMTAGGFSQLADRRDLEPTQPGDTRIYRFSDIAKLKKPPAKTKRMK